MEVVVALEYPNGRMYETVLYGDRVIGPGAEFEMYGRRWRAVGFRDGSRSDRRPRRLGVSAASTQVLCVCVGDNSLQATG
jgi:hypothetical protein